jgi:hypothetical protein
MSFNRKPRVLVVDGSLPGSYSTLSAAKEASQSGETIIVHPGTHYGKDLLKNGVNWHFHNGAHVAYIGSSRGSIFDTSDTGYGGAVTSRITGQGRFTLDPVGVDLGDAAGGERQNILLTVNHADDIYIEGIDATIEDYDDGVDGEFAQWGSAIAAKRGRVESRIVNLHGGAGPGIWWSDGPCKVKAFSVKGKSRGTDDTWVVWSSVPADPVFGNAWTNGHLDVTAEEIVSDGVCSLVYSDLGSSRTWISAKRLEVPADATGASSVVYQGQGRLYLDFQKLNGSADCLAVIQVGTDECWIDGMKVTAQGGVGILYDAAGGKSKIRLLHLEDLGATTHLVRATSGATSTIHDLEVQKAVGSADAVGILVDAGTFGFRGRLDTSANATASAFKVTAGSGRYLGGNVVSGASGKDLHQTGGTLYVHDGVGYDAGKTTGSITAVG